MIQIEYWLWESFFFCSFVQWLLSKRLSTSFWVYFLLRLFKSWETWIILFFSIRNILKIIPHIILRLVVYNWLIICIIPESVDSSKTNRVGEYVQFFLQKYLWVTSVQINRNRIDLTSMTTRKSRYSRFCHCCHSVKISGFWRRFAVWNLTTSRHTIQKNVDTTKRHRNLSVKNDTIVYPSILLCVNHLHSDEHAHIGAIPYSVLSSCLLD